MKILFLLLFMLTSSFRPTGCIQMDIVILADLSQSVRGDEKFIFEAINTFVDKLDTSEETIRFGVVGFNQEPFIIAGLQGDKEEIKKLVNGSIFYGEGLTYMNQGIQLALNQLYVNRFDAQKMMIIISDGNVTDEYATRETLNQIPFIGICSVLIKNSTCNPQFMKDIGNTCYVETNYQGLVTELAKMDVCL